MFQYLCLCFLSVFMHVQYDLMIFVFQYVFLNKMFKNVTCQVYENKTIKCDDTHALLGAFILKLS